MYEWDFCYRNSLNSTAYFQAIGVTNEVLNTSEMRCVEEAMKNTWHSLEDFKCQQYAEEGETTETTRLNLIYDQNGNLVSGNGKFRIYNSLNQLWKVYNGSSESGDLLFEYSYHPTQERVHYKVKYNGDGTNVTTIYLSQNYVRIINETGAIDDFTYVYHNGQQVAQLLPGGTKEFIHGDHIGSSTVVTNEAGDVIENTTYAPFGSVVSGGDETRYDYENKEFDSELGTYDFHFRQYNPSWGIFTKPDSLLTNVFNPQEINRYSFERNNPYKYTDPTGHSPQEPFDVFLEGLKWNAPQTIRNMQDSANKAWDAQPYSESVEKVATFLYDRVPFVKDSVDYWNAIEVLNNGNRGFTFTQEEANRKLENGIWALPGLTAHIPVGSQSVELVRKAADYYQYISGGNLYQDAYYATNNFVTYFSEPYTNELGQQIIGSGTKNIFRQSKNRRPRFCSTCKSGRDYNKDFSGYYDYDKQMSVVTPT